MDEKRMAAPAGELPIPLRGGSHGQTAAVLLCVALTFGGSWAQGSESETAEERLRLLRAQESELQAETRQLQERMAEVRAAIRELEQQQLRENLSAMRFAEVNFKSEVIYEKPSVQSGVIGRIDENVGRVSAWILDPQVPRREEPLGWWRVEYDEVIGYIIASNYHFESTETPELLQLLRAETLAKTREAEEAEKAGERAAEEVERRALVDAGTPFRIGVMPSEPDSAAGVSVSLTINVFDTIRVIKYLRLHVTPFNAIGDAVSSKIGGKEGAVLNVTGPVSAGDNPYSGIWKNVWYNSTIRCIEVDRIEVDYIDGSTYTYVRELPKILPPEYDNDCSWKG